MSNRVYVGCAIAPTRARSGAVVVGAIAALAGYGEASACTMLQPPLDLVGYPQDGAVDVPTDVVPLYETVTARLEGRQHVGAHFTLTSEEGELVPLVRRLSHIWHVELTPERPLAPNTTYELSYRAAEELDRVTFTTGDGAFVRALEPPAALLEHYEWLHGTGGSCEPGPTGTCVVIPAGTPVELSFIDSFGQEQGSYFYSAPTLISLSGINQGTNYECVKLRTRGPNATYSEPVVLCGADYPVSKLQGGKSVACTPEGLTQDGRLVASTSPSAPPSTPQPSSSDMGAPVEAGCSVGTRGAHCRLSGVLTLTALLLASGARRRRRRR